ncbi:MAG: DUF167 domain-containing protein [Candidatus Omnitrophica bacterium]|nr:DUF167 domain-containing protein [Candidatus Omnitrophota bacterium]
MHKLIHVRVVPRAKKSCVQPFGEGYKVYLTAPPVEGKANQELLKVLAAHFKVKKAQLSIIKGRKSKDKMIAIDQQSG